MSSEKNGSYSKQRIFLTYTPADEKDARRVRTLLEALPEKSVFTPDALSPGEHWSDRVREELKRSDIFMMLLSVGSLYSDYLVQELGAAWILGKPVVSVRTATGRVLKMPVEVKNLQSLDINDFDDPERVLEVLENAA